LFFASLSRLRRSTLTSSALETESFQKFAETEAVGRTVSLRPADQSVARTIWIVSIVLYIALATGTALTRQPYGDEGELASPTYNLVHRGHLEVTQWGERRESHKAYWMPSLFFFAQAGWQMIVGIGTEPDRIVAESNLLLDDAAEYDRRPQVHNPYGDVAASQRILQAARMQVGLPAAAKIAAMGPSVVRQNAFGRRPNVL
jgi:hypothetical protein